MLLNLVPILNIWPAIELGFFKGTTGENRFGDDPLLAGPDSADAQPSLQAD
jgi:uncharacterized membrane protein YhaH (DUF805 family)